eukprot:TRINITY_DN4127_c0_g3_i3.p1 TRINITY_DN4127_c0_g3~~TRINITY_DN4127_c0_g3_i3.p1  ORF type:complete len:100 (+),score=16.66 TRINITY_DN4127_c0_g3_i3:513-812(+)
MIKKIKEYERQITIIIQTFSTSRKDVKEKDYEDFLKWQGLNKIVNLYDVCMSSKHGLHEVRYDLGELGNNEEPMYENLTENHRATVKRVEWELEEEQGT